MTQPSDPSLPRTVSVVPAAPSVSPPDQEVVYYEGRPLLRADQAKAAFWLFVGIALIVLPILAMVNSWRWPGWLIAICFLAAIAAMVLPWLVIRTTRYRISNYRIDFERGLLTKRIDTLELWHVDDLKFEQGLLDRMMNVGSIIVMSNDKTTPKLNLHGVPNPRQIFDSLKERVIAVKRQRGVVKMDVG